MICYLINVRIKLKSESKITPRLVTSERPQEGTQFDRILIHHFSFCLRTYQQNLIELKKIITHRIIHCHEAGCNGVNNRYI